MSFHNGCDSLEQLVKDAKDSDNPQHRTPDSVQQSAIEELRERRYSPQEIQHVRLYGEIPGLRDY